MGKASRVRAQRRANSRPLFVVDQLEVGHRAGVLTLRLGRHSPGVPPQQVCLPVEGAAQFLDKLRTASIDAEEDYWSVIGPVVRGTGSSDAAVVAAAMERWLLKQDWRRVLAAVPADAEGLILLSYAGHVGVALDPPFTVGPVLAILDPLQLRRVEDGLADAAAAAAQKLAGGRAAAPILLRLAAAHEFLAAQPWPPSAAASADPTRQQAEAEMRRRHTDFLTRTPHLRSPENDIVLDDD